MKNYICECGEEFVNSQKFNSHKAHCKQHHLAKYGNLDKYNQKKEFDRQVLARNRARSHEMALARKEMAAAKREKDLLIWISEKHTCERCGKVMTEKFATGRFCSVSCANSRGKSDEVKKKISNALYDTYHGGSTKSAEKIRQIKAKYMSDYYSNPKLCHCCGKIIPYERRKLKCCCNECAKELRNLGAKKGGKMAAAKRVLRSKNEIYFCELCEKHFNSVRHNEPIFNG